jgi:hypothetical protein
MRRAAGSLSAQALPARLTLRDSGRHRGERAIRHRRGVLGGGGGHRSAVRGGDQTGVVGFGQAGAVALAAAVDMHPVEEPARLAGFQAGHARHRQAPTLCEIVAPRDPRLSFGARGSPSRIARRSHGNPLAALRLLGATALRELC